MVAWAYPEEARRDALPVKGEERRHDDLCKQWRRRDPLALRARLCARGGGGGGGAGARAAGAERTLAGASGKHVNVKSKSTPLHMFSRLRRRAGARLEAKQPTGRWLDQAPGSRRGGG